MRLRGHARALARKLTLTRQVAILSVLPMVVLGFVLARVLQDQIVTRTLADETRSAHLIARIGIQPRLTPADMQHGLSAAGVAALDRQLRSPAVHRELARIKIWNAADRVIYSDDHTLIGRTLPPSDDLERALRGRAGEAVLVNPTRSSETAEEVGLGELIEVYVPLRFRTSGAPAGAFEMYLSYRPVAGAISRDKNMIALLIGIGLALLWLVLYRIAARASRRLVAQAEENDRLARLDQLTALPNRRLFGERLARRLRSLDPGAGSVLVADVVGFKQVNSTLGPDAGDEVLREIAARLRALPGEGTLVARLGSDEFAAFVEHRPGGWEEAVASAQAAVEQPLEAAGVVLNLELRIGVAVAEDPSVGPAETLARAEAALTRAPGNARRIERYSPELDSFDPDRLVLLGEIPAAIERGEFVLHYQPKLDLRTRRITSVEGLIRWEHPERGLLAPAAFMPLVEPTALVGDLTMHVIELGALQLSRWNEEGIELGMSLNLSARNLLDERLPARFQAALDEQRLSPGRFTLEVTESAAMTDPAKAIAVLGELRACGASVSIDDFGTGNASIDYLARLPADELKIDRSFVAEICADARSEAIVRSTIDLSRRLGLEVVAEGIETAEVLERLVELGCDVAQGYLISRPVPAAQIAPLLAQEEAHPEPAARPAIG